MNENEKNQNPEDSLKAQESIDVQLKECQIQMSEWKDRFLRTAADFENFKKRNEKEKTIWITSAQSSLLQDLIGIVDDFDRAFSSPAHNNGGFELIYKSLQKLLEKYGVQEMKPTGHFDPMMQEAIMQVESPDHAAGDIVNVLQKGYLFKGEVLRPAKVSVAK